MGAPNTFDERIHNDCIPASIFDTLQGPISRNLFLFCNTCYEVSLRHHSTMLCTCSLCDAGMGMFPGALALYKSYGIRYSYV